MKQIKKQTEKYIKNKHIITSLLLILIGLLPGCGRKKLNKEQPIAERIDNRHLNLK